MDRDRQTVRIFLVLIEIVLWSSFGATFAAGQTTQPKPAPGSKTAAKRAQTPVLAEEFFKNVQVLKGIPVSEFMDTMGFFAASLSLNCTSCHGLESASDVSRFADDTPLKQTARKMILMVRAINREHFAGQRLITCYTCHRGDERPKERPESRGAIWCTASRRSKRRRNSRASFRRSLCRSGFRQVPGSSRESAAARPAHELCRPRNLLRL